MNKAELERKIREFNENDLDNIISKEAELEKIRKAFTEEFTTERIRELTLEGYAVGAGKKNNSFCYRLEKELDELGKLYLPAGSGAYGVWIDGDLYKEKIIKCNIDETRYDKNDPDNAFENAKNDIADLIEAGEANNKEAISRSPVYSLVKNKLLYTYFPDRYPNITAKDNAMAALYVLGVNIPPEDDIIPIYEALMDWKNSNEETKGWSNYALMRFLYDKLKLSELKDEGFNAAKNPLKRKEAENRKKLQQTLEANKDNKAKEKEREESVCRENAEKLKRGTVVLHKTYGKGTVISTDDNKVIIEFAGAGEKKLGLKGIFDFIAID